MTIQEIKDQIAKEEGFSNWKDVMKHQFPGPTNRMMDEVAKRYACACCEESLKKAAENACTGVNERWDLIDADSITSEDNIVLL